MENQDEFSGGMYSGRTLRCFLVPAFFFLAAIVATWPLAWHFTTHLPHGANDLNQNVWNLWWWKTALFDLQTSPFATPLLYAPDGLDLTFHTHSPFNMLITMPVNLLAGHVAAYNTSVIMAVFLAGLGAYLLLRKLVRDELPALAGGLIFALLPQHQEQLFEHLNLFSCQFMPFTILFLIKTFRSGTATNGILTGLFFALTALASWHLGILLALLAVPCAVWYGWHSPCRRKAIGWLCVGGALCTLTLLPFLWPMLKALIGGEAYFKKPLVYRPVDLAFFVLPPPQSTLLGGVARDLYLAHRGNAFQYAGFVCFLGWIPLTLLGWLLVRLVVTAWKEVRLTESFVWLLFFFVLVLIFTSIWLAAGLWLAVSLLWRAFRRAGVGEGVLWLYVFLLFVVFSLGWHPLVLGTEHPAVSLPQGWLKEASVFRVLRVANRYLIPGSLAFAVLTAMGLARLPRMRVLRWAAVLLIFLEFLWLPFPTRPHPRYPYLEALAEDPQRGIVLDIPPCTRAAHTENMLRQIAHRGPLVGGYAAAVPPEKRDAMLEPFYDRGLTLDKPAGRGGGASPPPRLDRRWLREIKEQGIGTIIVKPSETREGLRRRYDDALERGELPFFLRRLRPARGLPERRLETIVDQLWELLDRPAYEDDNLIVWRVR